MDKRILIAKEKHCIRYFDASTNEVLHNACIKLLKERLEDGWYDGREIKQEIEALINHNDIQMGKRYPKSYVLLNSNSDYEYEHIELNTLEDVK